METKHLNEIEVIVNLAWEGKKIHEEEKKIVKTFFNILKVFETHQGKEI